jgi:hypothetical protein
VGTRVTSFDEGITKTGKCAHFRLDLVTPLEPDVLSQDPHRADGTRAHLYLVQDVDAKRSARKWLT